MGLTESQRRALAILPKPTGVLSTIGSSLIVLSVLRDVKKRSRIHNRLVAGMSLADICISFGTCLSTWPIPEDSGAMFAVGTEQTCIVQGFVIQMGIATTLYNAVLSIYYLLLLFLGYNESQVRRIEPFMHLFPWAWGLCTGIMGIPLELYNNANLWCWIASYPAGCVGEECIRNPDADFYRWTFFYGPLWSGALFVTISMFLVLARILQASHRHGNELSNDAVDSEDLIAFSEELHMNNEQLKRAKRVRRDMVIQCFLYAGSFYINWVPLSVSVGCTNNTMR